MHRVHYYFERAQFPLTFIAAVCCLVCGPTERVKPDFTSSCQKQNLFSNGNLTTSVCVWDSPEKSIWEDVGQNKKVLPQHQQLAATSNPHKTTKCWEQDLTETLFSWNEVGKYPPHQSGNSRLFLEANQNSTGTTPKEISSKTRDKDEEKLLCLRCCAL